MFDLKIVTQKKYSFVDLVFHFNISSLCQKSQQTFNMTSFIIVFNKNKLKTANVFYVLLRIRVFNNSWKICIIYQIFQGHILNLQVSFSAPFLPDMLSKRLL